MKPFNFLAFIAFTFLFPITSLAEEPKTVPWRGFTILHTNDLHGHLTAWRGWEGNLAGKMVGGMDRMAAAVNKVRQEMGAENVVLLDAGDTLGDTMIASKTQGKAVIEVMNALDYTAMVIGNHEPDFSAPTLKERIAEARFPILAANITQKDSGQLFTKPYLIKEVRGTKLGILGLAYPSTPATTAKKNVSGLEFAEASAVAREFIPKLKSEGAQLIVVLSHLGLQADKKLAKEVTGIDVIVGGHSHNRMQTALQQGNTLIVQAGAHGSDLGRLNLEVRNGKVVAHEHSLITLDNAIVPSDPKIAALINNIYNPYLINLEEKIGRATAPIRRAQTIGGQEAGKRDQESPADSLFADLIRDKTKADVVILPGLGYGTAIPQGMISAAHLRNLIPHDSEIVTLQLTGLQIRDILEQSLENTYAEDPAKNVGGVVQVSGLRFKYKAERKHPQRIVDVRINNAKLDPQRTYKVATNSLLAEGGHNYTTFLQGKNKQHGATEYEMVRQGMQRSGKVHTPKPDRIEKVTEPN